MTTLGTEFLRDVTGSVPPPIFRPWKTVTLAWQQTQQNFVIVDGWNGGQNLENPGPNSFQSGIAVGLGV